MVVGGSFAGQTAIKQLLELDPKGHLFDIVLVDKSSFFEFVCTNPVSLTHEEHFHNINTSFSTVTQSFRSSHVSFRQGRLVKINDEHNEIEIESV